MAPIMKLKCQPDDFRVEELPDVQPGARGRYTFYRLTKRGVGTPEAIEAIRRRWDLAGARIDYGGLKDRHATTIQYLTILEGPHRELAQPNITLEPLGRLPFPYGPKHFHGNGFTIVLRDLKREELERLERAAVEIDREGLPNYFDDQRFGSVGASGEFIGEAWARGDHERALWLAIVETTASDRPESRREKAILREHWGQWAEAKARLDRSHARSLVTYLVDHPTDFRGAFARLRRDLRSIYFSAYQSHLWNQMLARRIEDICRPDQRVTIRFKTAAMPVYRGLDADQIAALTAWPIPLPAARGAPPTGEPGALLNAVLAERALAWSDLRVKHLKDVFFSKGDRPAVFWPVGLRSASGPDALHGGRRQCTVRFELPKGAYATMLVKRLTDAS